MTLFRIYCRLQKDLPPSFTWERFQKHCIPWDIIELIDSDGKCSGAVMQKGPELHIVYFKDPTASIIKHLRANLKRVIDEYGFSITSVEDGNEKSMKFCSRLGFVPCGRENGVTLMVCKQWPFERCKK